jgi:hypothetical protein
MTEVVGEVVGDLLGEPRAQVAEALAGYLDEAQLARLMNSVLAIEKSAWATCPKCSGHVKVAIADTRAVVSSISELLTQAYGRPSDRQAETEIIVNRTVHLVCDHGHPCEACASEEAGHEG